MNFLDRVDVVILTWNEEANLARTLDALRRFPRVLVLDSGSTDGTLDIAARYPNVRSVCRPFDSHASQWNHAVHETGLTAEWTLALDADYVLPAALVDEIAALQPAPPTRGMRARFRYCVAGRALSGSLYPPVVVLYRRESARYVQDGHTQRVLVDGAVEELSCPVSHDDRKPFAAWLAAQDRYARLECDLLRSKPWSVLGWRDRLRRMVWITPWLVPLYCLTVGRGLLDGRRGLFYALQRGIAEAILSVRLIESTFKGRA
jgi:glycosyltransferase involved in cell wall biosynthesis